MIPGCVERGVRLGSESSSGGAGAGGGVWKSWNLEIWEFGDLGIWRSEDLEIQKFGDLGTWKSRNLGSKKKEKRKVLKIQIRSAPNVGKVWISRKKSSWPYLGPSEAIFSIDRKNPKNAKILPIFLGANGPLFTRFGSLLLSTWGGGIG